MPVIDRSEEIDIDIDIGLNSQELEPKVEENKNLSSNPILKEMEEEEIEKDNNLFEKSTKSEEKAFYETLSDTEKDAWDRGWRTGKFFKGRYKDGTLKPHKTAQEFLEVQEKETPVLNERNRKLTAEKTALEKRLEDMQKQMDVILNVQKFAYEDNNQKRFQSLDEAEENAILEGDVAKVRAIQKQRNELEKNKISFAENKIDENIGEEPKSQIQPEDKKIFDNWAPDNTWFYENASMRGYAETYFATLSERISLRERLEMVSEEIQSRFSDKLNITRAPSVESGQRGINVGKKQYTYNDLPLDVRQTCQYFAKKHNFTVTQIKDMHQNAINDYFNN
jgi:hypothetical protein